MEAAKCPICGQRHFGAEHIWPKEPLSGGKDSPPKVATPSKAQRVSLHVNEPVVDRIEPVRNAQHETAGEKPKFDRTAYQREYMREYMRKRRAKL